MRKISRCFLGCLILVGGLVSIKPADASWVIVATWVQSEDEALDRDEVYVNGEVKCVVDKGEIATCQWDEEALSGQTIVVRSYTRQGGFVDGATGKILEISNPASGLIINITQLP